MNPVCGCYEPQAKKSPVNDELSCDQCGGPIPKWHPYLQLAAVASRSDAKELTANDVTNLEKIATLRGFLGKIRKYVAHTDGCEMYPNIHGTHVCSCGLEQVLAETP